MTVTPKEAEQIGKLRCQYLLCLGICHMNHGPNYIKAAVQFAKLIDLAKVVPPGCMLYATNKLLTCQMARRASACPS